MPQVENAWGGSILRVQILFVLYIEVKAGLQTTFFTETVVMVSALIVRQLYQSTMLHFRATPWHESTLLYPRNASNGKAKVYALRSTTVRASPTKQASMISESYLLAW